MPEGDLLCDAALAAAGYRAAAVVSGLEDIAIVIVIATVVVLVKVIVRVIVLVLMVLTLLVIVQSKDSSKEIVGDIIK